MSSCIHCDAPLPENADFCPECGQSQATLPAADAPLMTLGAMATLGEQTTGSGARAEGPTLEPGARFAERYTILGPLGAGGMGVVYRAKDDMGDREVALKLIRPERSGSEREVQRLVEEGLTARDIRHPGVVAVYDVGSWQGTPYLSMEVVEGQSLRGWMRERMARGEDVGADAALAIVRAIAEGLRAAHAKGVVHRDLKPENVILETPPRAGEARLKVLDFGIARAGRGTSAESGTGTGVGTPRYMAPEQVTNADLAGPSADVYSLSVMLYELLVGVLPQGHWQPPSSGRSDVPRAIDALVQEGLSNRPQARPQTMDAFLERLEGAGGGESIVDAGRRAFADLEKARESWRANLKARWTPKWTKVAAAVLALCVAAGIADELGLLDEEPAYAGGYVEDAGAYESPDFDVKEAAREEVEGDAMPDDWSVLSGTWEHTTGNVFDVTVSRFGRVRGEGSMLYDDGFNVGQVPATIRGKIKDGSLTYDLRMNGQVFAKGEGSWLGGGEFTVQHFSPEGMHLEGNVILVNGGRGF